jgi:hypothetical protein
VRFRFNKIDWRGLRENKQLKFNIGLAVVLILFFAFFLDMIFSVSKFRHYMEERPKKEEKVTKKEKAVKEKASIPKKVTARVAIILDDAGGNMTEYNEIRSIKKPLTISIIPDLPTSAKVAKAMADAGFEVILHLPMEALNGSYRRSGGGMISCSASDQEIKKTLNDDLSSVKCAVGLNNHMGSKATADERVMTDIFNTIKGRGLYFIDSRTSDRSIALKLARSFHIPSAENNIFLDSDVNRNFIKSNLRHLISIARQKGSAIGIGHATRPATISALKELMPEYENDGVKFVHASELVK